MTNHTSAAADDTPRIVIDATQIERLRELAAIAFERSPDVADSLMRELDRAEVRPPEEMPADVVAIGSAVTYRDEVTGRVHDVRLVHPQDADIDRGRISVLTPLGAALIGLSAGASMAWTTRAGAERRLTVLAAGDGPAA